MKDTEKIEQELADEWAAQLQEIADAMETMKQEHFALLMGRETEKDRMQKQAKARLQAHLKKEGRL